MAEKPQKNTFMKKMVSAYFKRKSLETKANMNETDMLADVSTVGNETMAEYEDLLMDEVWDTLENLLGFNSHETRFYWFIF